MSLGVRAGCGFFTLGYAKAELIFLFAIDRGPRLNQLLHELAAINSARTDSCRCRRELNQKLIRCNRLVFIRAIQLLREKHLHLDLIVLANHTLAGANQVSVRLGRLDLEHDRYVSLVDQLNVRGRAITLSRPEANVGDGVQRDKLPPVFLLLGRRSKRCLCRLHRHTTLSINYIITSKS